MSKTGGYTAVAEDSYTRPANTTQYTAGDQVADSATAPTALDFVVARQDGGTGLIVAAVCVDSAAQATKANLRLYLFDTSPTPNNDNAAWAPSDADMANLLPGGVIDFAEWEVGTSTAGADGNCASFQKALNIPYQCISGAKSIYGLLVERSTYTPVSGETLTLRLGVAQD